MIERKHTSSGRLATSVASLPDSGYCSLMGATGQGTTADPLRTALLVRTVDWADEETTPDAARSTTTRVHAALQGGLSASTNPASALQDALLAAETEAATTRDYFSACAAIVTGRQVTIAGIGYVRAWMLRGDTYRVLIEPNIRPANPKPGASVGLLASIGGGYSLDKARLAEVVMEPGDLVLITMSGELMEMPVADPSEAIGPETFLRRVKPVEMEPSIIAVIGGDPDAPPG